MPQGQRHALLQSALQLYVKADEIAREGDDTAAEFASLHKNLAATYFASFGCSTAPIEERIKHLSFSISHTVHAVKSRRNALHVSSSAPVGGASGPVLTEEWLDGMAIKLGERVSALTSIDQLTPEHKVLLVRQASKELRDIARDTAAGPSLALLARATFNAAVTASDGMQDADTLRACAHPKQLLSEASEMALLAEAAGHAVEPDDLGGFKALHDGTFAGAIWRMECICESTRLRFLGEKEAATAKSGAEGGDLDVERVWMAVDLLKTAAVESRGYDAESEARACEALGEVFQATLSLTDLAGKYYYDSVACALAALGRTFEGAAWFRRATAGARRSQEAKEQRVLEDAWKIREPALERLKLKLEAIKAAADKSWQALLAHLYKESPPAPSKLLEYVLPEKMTAADGKKVLLKAIAQYHPDKQVDVVAEMGMGNDWLVLCEEIVKHLNIQYGNFK